MLKPYATFEAWLTFPATLKKPQPDPSVLSQFWLAPFTPTLITHRNVTTAGMR